MMRTRWLLGVAVLAAIGGIVALVGCGGGSPDYGSSTPASSATSGTASTTVSSGVQTWAQRVDTICGSVNNQLNMQSSASATTSTDSAVIAGLVAGAYDAISKIPSPSETGGQNFVAALKSLSSAWNELVAAVKEGSSGQLQSASASLSQAKKSVEAAANQINATNCAALAKR